ncbi:DUF7344 domain-containing protein [Halomontanus rarus]|uniref:DUF7344 domain-containing protein n=1 Tax=Halomontanus rarus TaxID=3034020 RepID=UPI001A9947F9
MGTRRPARSSRSVDESAGEYWDEVFDAFAAARRRLVVVLLHRSDRLSVETLAARIGDLEAEYGYRYKTTSEPEHDTAERVADRPDDGDRTRAREIATALRHVHLPKLEDVGLLEWDRREDVVSLAANRRTDDLERRLVRDVAARQFDGRIA